MPGCYDEFHNVGEYFNFSPAAVERLTHHHNTQEISPGYVFTGNNKRKIDAVEANYDFNQQLLLTPPQTPMSQQYQQTRVDTWASDVYQMYQYNMTSPTDNPAKFRKILPRHESENTGYYQVNLQFQSYNNSNNSLNGNINSNTFSPGLHFLYEKSLNSVRRWRENGLTVQLFYCVVCGLPTDDEERMKRHIELHHGKCVSGGQLHCTKCNDVFNNEDSFLSHTATNHKDESVCKGCTREFENIDILEKHQKQCVEYSPYRCEYCGAGFVINIRLKSHRNSCESSRTPPTFSCKVCSKQFSKKAKYTEHLPIHAFM